MWAKLKSSWKLLYDFYMNSMSVGKIISYSAHWNNLLIEDRNTLVEPELDFNSKYEISLETFGTSLIEFADFV